MTAATLTPRAAERLAGIARVMWIILGLNLVVALAKLAYGYRSSAIAITADGIHSLLDSASTVIGLIGISVARRPADSNCAGTSLVPANRESSLESNYSASIMSKRWFV